MNEAQAWSRNVAKDGSPAKYDQLELLQHTVYSCVLNILNDTSRVHHPKYEVECVRMADYARQLIMDTLVSLSPSIQRTIFDLPNNGYFSILIVVLVCMY